MVLQGRLRLYVETTHCDCGGIVGSHVLDVRYQLVPSLESGVYVMRRSCRNLRDVEGVFGTYTGAFPITSVNKEVQ